MRLLACLLLAASLQAATITTLPADWQPLGEPRMVDLRNLPGDVRTVTLEFEQPLAAFGVVYDRWPEAVGTGICFAGECVPEDAGFFGVTLADPVLAMTLETLGPWANRLKEYARVQPWGLYAPEKFTAVPEPSGFMLLAVVVFMLGIRAVVSGLRRRR